MQISGRVFNIEKYHINDGNGIRTAVFLKGCNLICPWCSNPESQSKNIQIVTHRNLCKHCGLCQTICPVSAIKHCNNQFVTDVNKCNYCNKCVELCPHSARQIYGYDVTVSEVMKEIMKDAAYYSRSGGGITITGGEPLLQPSFVKALLQACHDEYISTAIETAGVISIRTFMVIASLADEVLIDVKTLEPEKMQTLIEGKVGGEQAVKLVTDNIKMASDKGINIILRCPIIPDFNNSEEHIEKVINLAKSCNINRIDLLPFHQYGKYKYKSLNKHYEYENIKQIKDIELDSLRRKIESEGFDCIVGG